MTDPDFTPHNDLEEMLVRAATDPALRFDFYRRLLEADVFFLKPVPPDGEDRPASSGTTAEELQRWDGPKGTYIPCFSSRPRAEEVAESTGQICLVATMPGQEGFQLLAETGEEAFLNPGLGYGKRFSRREIKRLADGTIMEGDSLVMAAMGDRPTAGAMPAAPPEPAATPTAPMEMPPAVTPAEPLAVSAPAVRRVTPAAAPAAPAAEPAKRGKPWWKFW
jgi:hypothetical protein